MIILANGCFDVIHSGHIDHLREARGPYDILIVSLTMDDCVNKPGRPVNTWTDRAKVLEALRLVDMVIPTRNAVDAIRSIRPHVFVKGIDYKDSVFTEDVEAACKEVGAELRFTNSAKRSSTDIIRKLRDTSHS